MMPETPSYHPTSMTSSSYITLHDFPPGGASGLLDFSISPIIRSNAFVTCSLYRALASVHEHLNSSPKSRPCSAVTCLCSGRKSDLLPTMMIGTQSAPCCGSSEMYEVCVSCCRRVIPSDSGSCHGLCGSCRMTVLRTPSRPTCSHVCR